MLFVGGSARCVLSLRVDCVGGTAVDEAVTSSAGGDSTGTLTNVMTIFSKLELRLFGLLLLSMLLTLFLTVVLLELSRFFVGVLAGTVTTVSFGVANFFDLSLLSTIFLLVVCCLITFGVVEGFITGIVFLLNKDCCCGCSCCCCCG